MSEHYQQFESLDALSRSDLGEVHLAVGMFDGLHIGHRTVIESAVARKTGSSAKVGVLTFWPHPSRLFNPAVPTRMILTPECKRVELSKYALDFVVEEPFTREFAAVEASQFVDYLIQALPGLKTLHAGDNWRFGKGRSGDMEALKTFASAKGITVYSLDCHEIEGSRVSSTRIRELLQGGSIVEANRLLGYGYYSLSTVTQGKRLGRQIGVPTLNLPFEGDLRPRYGVYSVYVADVDSDHWYPAVANFGVKPTVQDDPHPLLEVHILGDCPFDYGHRLKARWIRFLRPEEKFDGLDSLKKQIEKDIEDAKAHLTF